MIKVQEFSTGLAWQLTIGLSIILAVFGCRERALLDSSPVFRSIDASVSGLDFRNDLQADGRQNIFNYMYFFNGAGVGVGDFDGDGLQDVYFASNQSFSRVYRNLGDLKFEDVTSSSGLLRDSVWSTGVSVVDVNADGLPDVYESVVSLMSVGGAASRLYINVSRPGEIRFKERSAAFGLAVKGFGTQAAWLDQDRDGTLDVYLLRHSIHQKGTFGARARSISVRDAEAGDLLFRGRDGSFTDITDSSGVYSSALGYGLGVTTADFNLDGWEDIYVANDFHEDDYLYLNDQQGGLRESSRLSLQHTSRYSMGVDVGDLNRDAIPDIMVLDMLPDDPRILKSSAAEDPYNIWEMKSQSGYWPQYSRNTLQLSRGLSPADSTVPLYAEVAVQSGIHATDWSWSALIQDFNLDGLPDVFISNGVLGRSNDLDYINYVTTPQNQAKLKDRFISAEDLSLSAQMPEIRLRNRLYLGQGGGGFRQNQTYVGPESFSHGASYVDLDNDGDLDLITSDVNGVAQLLENTTNPAPAAWIGLDLTQGPQSDQADGANLAQIGSSVMLLSGDRVLAVQRVQPVRGFLSTSDHRLLFALAAPSTADNLLVRWADGSFTQHELPTPGTYSSIVRGAGRELPTAEGTRLMRDEAEPMLAPYVTTSAADLGIDYLHRENPYFEFDAQSLMPEMTSAAGPALVVADFTGDGLDDIYFGGARGQEDAIYVQQPGGRFVVRPQPDLQALADRESVEGLALDVDADGDLDLVIGYGGSEWPVGDAHYIPLVLQNDGAGIFSPALGAIPETVNLIAGALLAADINSDGRPDLILLPRTQAGAYGRQDNRGFLLIADGDGNFIDRTAEAAPFLLHMGMVTDAQWLEGCGRTQLVVAYNWGPVLTYPHSSAGFGEQKEIAPPGLWTSISILPGGAACSPDLILGNLGYNSKLAARGDSTVCMYVADIDENGTAEQLVTVKYDGIERLFATRDELSKQLVYLRKKFPSYHSFSEATLSEIIPADRLAQAKRTCIASTGSVLAKAQPSGDYVLEVLPDEFQISPILSGDTLAGRALLFGNNEAINVQRGRYDASFGFVIGPDLQTGIPARTGVFVSGQSRVTRSITVAGRRGLLIGRNNAAPALIFPR